MNYKPLEKAELRSLAMRTGGAGGQVNRHHPKLAEASLDVTALAVEPAHAEALPHLVGRAAAIERDAAVALLLRERMAALEGIEAVQLGIEVGLVALQLLKADHVGVLRFEPAEETFFCRRPDAVDVEGDDFQEEEGVEAPPCAADHLAGSCRNFSTS